MSSIISKGEIRLFRRSTSKYHFKISYSDPLTNHRALVCFLVVLAPVTILHNIYLPLQRSRSAQLNKVREHSATYCPPYSESFLENLLRRLFHNRIIVTLANKTHAYDFHIPNNIRSEWLSMSIERWSPSSAE